MGVRTDVVIADVDEAKAVADTDDPATNRNGFTFNGFDHVQLCTLLSLLTSGGPDADFETYLDRINVVSASSGEWPAVSVVIPELVAEVAAVAALEGSQFEALVAAWASTEEFAGWSGADVQD